MHLYVETLLGPTPTAAGRHDDNNSFKILVDYTYKFYDQPKSHNHKPSDLGPDQTGPPLQIADQLATGKPSLMVINQYTCGQ
jgi:hypothetical protein